MLVTHRDKDVLLTLVNLAQVLSDEQVAATWWEGRERGLKQARRRMCRLVSLGLLSRHSVIVRPTPALEQPLCRWRPGEPCPNLEGIAYAAQKRWLVPPVRSTVYRATDKTRKLFGASRRLPLKFVQVGHALGVSQMYLVLRKTNPTVGQSWVVEPDDLEAAHVPDAILVDPVHKTPILWLDFIAHYPSQRLLQLHRASAADNIPYIWY